MNTLISLINRFVSWKKSLTEQLEEADAVILEISSPGFIKKQTAAVRLLLQVAPKNRRNFIIEYHDYLSEEQLKGLRQGCTVKIYFHPRHPSRIRALKAPGE